MDHKTLNMNGSGNEANCNQDELNMSFDDGNQESPAEVGSEDSSNFLEENLKAVHGYFERLNTILHESNEEIPYAAEIVLNNFHQMSELKLDLESKYAELKNLAGDLNLVSSSRDPEEHILKLQQSSRSNTTTGEEGRLAVP